MNLDAEIVRTVLNGDLAEVEALAARLRVRPADLIAAVDRRADPGSPAFEVRGLVLDAIAGKRRALDAPWPVLAKATRALAPATITLVVAGPGASKSFMVLQWFAYLHDAGERVALLELEDGRAYHLRRALAQRAHEAGITRDEWCAENAALAKSIAADHADWLDSFGACVADFPTEAQPTLEAVGDWVEAQAAAGARVIGVDPISIAEIGKDQHVHDQRFVARCKRIAEGAGCSIVLVLHPRKGAAAQSIDDVAGGASYGRLAQTVIWLEHTGEPRELTVRDSRMDLQIVVTCNRILHIVKSRNGPGQGFRIALWFDQASLCLRELGVIVRATAGKP